MKRFIGLLIILAMGVYFISGCSSVSKTSSGIPLNSQGEIKIAVLGSEEQFENYQDFFYGADMAIEKLTASNVKISYEKIDDQGNYDNAVNIATDISKDNNYTMAITVQDVDVVGPVVYLFNEAQKPIIIASQALSKIMNYGYAYAINSTLLAQEQGYLAGKTAIENNAKWVVASHSSSPFDKEFINGFQLATNGSSTTLMDVREISGSLTDNAEATSTFLKLKPDTILVAHYNAQYLVETIKLLREVLHNQVEVFTNASILNYKTVSENKNVLTNVLGIASYPVNLSDTTKSFMTEYKTKYGVDADASSCQGYDIMNLISNKIQGVNSTLDFMNNVKSEEGYAGLANLKFDMLGRLVSDNAIKFGVDNNGNITLERLTF